MTTGRPVINLEDRIFGQWLVTGIGPFSKSSSGKVYNWHVVCINCEYCTIKQGGNLKNGNASVCPKCRARKAAIWDYFCTYRSGAVKRGYPFKLTLKQFTHFIFDCCYYCGSVPCCKTCNLGKHKKSEQEFIAWIERLRARPTLPFQTK